jgi:hypothetical protein
MKGGGSRVGATEWAHQPLGGASRGVRRSRRGGRANKLPVGFGGGKRTFIKRTCRSKSRCGGRGEAWFRVPCAYVPA